MWSVTSLGAKIAYDFQVHPERVQSNQNLLHAKGATCRTARCKNAPHGAFV